MHTNVAFCLGHSLGLVSASRSAGLALGYRAAVCQQAQTLGDLEEMHIHTAKQPCCLTHVGLAGGEREDNLAIAFHGTRALLKLAHC